MDLASSHTACFLHPLCCPRTDAQLCVAGDAVYGVGLDLEYAHGAHRVLGMCEEGIMQAVGHDREGARSQPNELPPGILERVQRWQTNQG